MRGRWVRVPKIYSLEGLPIDNAKTLEMYGYEATNVSTGSLKKVCCWCVKCGHAFQRIRRRITPETTCASCGHTADGKPNPFPRDVGYQKVERVCVCGRVFTLRRKSVYEGVKCPRCRRLAPDAFVVNPYLDDIETQKRFGYSASAESAKSFRRVVVRCATCGTIFERIRRNVRDQPLCVRCSYGVRDTNPRKRKRPCLRNTVQQA